jgi:glutathione peroxidase-family protein
MSFKKLFHLLTILALSLINTAARPIELGYKIGDYAADFELKNIDGSMVKLGMMKYSSAKGFIIVFTCNHCPFSKKYEDGIIALNKKYEPLGYPLVAINPNDPELEPEDSFANMQTQAKEKDFTFPYLFDETQVTTCLFGAKKTPQIFILKKESGQLKVVYMGAIDSDFQTLREKREKYSEQAMDELLAGKAVSNPNTIAKLVGCGIKFKQ